MIKGNHFCKYSDCGFCHRPKQQGDTIEYWKCVGVKQCIFHNKTKEEETASDGKTN